QITKIQGDNEMSASSTSVPTNEDQAASNQSAAAQLNLNAPSFIHHPPDLARHRRKCSICCHPERETIEDLFIHWHSPNTIANYFDDTADDAEDAGDESHNLPPKSGVTIHPRAPAPGLSEVRHSDPRFAFEHIRGQAGDNPPT